MIKRYHVYWVDLNPVVGSEMSKLRPAVVVSDDDMNAHLQTVVVCPVTSRLHPRWPSRVQTVIDGRDAEIAVDQIRTVARSRLGDSLGPIPDAAAESLRHVITQMYGILSYITE
jgi:mRNA interferase MazF